jgi:hypothetical protein
MNLMQVPAFYVYVILGSILIAVLFLDKQFNRRGKGGDAPMTMTRPALRLQGHRQDLSRGARARRGQISR